jgi:hypothetical protein
MEEDICGPLEKECIPILQMRNLVAGQEFGDDVMLYSEISGEPFVRVPKNIGHKSLQRLFLHGEEQFKQGIKDGEAKSLMKVRKLLGIRY